MESRETDILGWEEKEKEVGEGGTEGRDRNASWLRERAGQ